MQLPRGVSKHRSNREALKRRRAIKCSAIYTKSTALVNAQVHSSTVPRLRSHALTVGPRPLLISRSACSMLSSLTALQLSPGVFNFATVHSISISGVCLLLTMHFIDSCSMQ